MNSRQMVFSI